MRYFIALLMLALSSGVSSAQAQQVDSKPLAITHVTVIDVIAAAPQPDMTVIINGNRITALGKANKVRIPPGAQVIDATGKFLIPGLWDMHIHLTVIPDQEVTRNLIAPLLVAYGITGVRDMGGDWQRLQTLRNEIAGGQTLGPRIFTPGPFVDGPQAASHIVLPVSNEEEARQAVRKLKAQGVDFIKVQAALSLPLWQAVLDEAQRLNIMVAGHIPERISAFDVARSTQRSIEHISPVLPGDAGVLLACSGKEAELRAEMLEIERLAEQPNPDQQALRKRYRALQAQMISTTDDKKCAQLLSLFAKRGTVAVPTMIFGRQFAPLDAGDLPKDEALGCVPHSMRVRWENRRNAVIKSSAPEDFAFRRQMFEKSLALVGLMHRAGIRLLAGTDAIDGYVVPGLSLHQELALMVEAGLTPLEALQAATIHAARFLGKDKELGTIAAGKLADVVLLDASPLSDIHNTQKISAVFSNGRWLDRQTLNELLAKVEAAASQK
jgi:Imidazolonepropionase and related amidohydrolases